MDNATTTLVQISQDIADTADTTAGRAATVVEVDGLSVRVKFADETAAGETWYPSTVAGLPVNTWGTVEPLRGNAGYFVPIGIPYIDPVLYVDTAELTTTLGQYATDAEVATLLASYYTKTQIDTMLGPFATEAEVAALYYNQSQVNNLLALKANKPVRNRNKGAGDQVISAAGDYPFKLGSTNSCDVGLSGLEQSVAYSVHVDLFMRIAGGASTSGQIGFQLIGATTVTETYNTNTTWAAANERVMWSYEQEVTSTSGGAITVRPITRWGVGSFTPVYCTCAVRAEKV